MSERARRSERDGVSQPPHVLEIDSIVLQVAPGARRERLAAQIEAEVGRVLAQSTMPAPTPVQRGPSVAGEIARTVVRAIGTSAHGA